MYRVPNRSLRISQATDCCAAEGNANPEWVSTPFFAEYDENAIWLDDLKPAFEEKFFFEDELKAKYNIQK